MRLSRHILRLLGFLHRQGKDIAEGYGRSALEIPLKREPFFQMLWLFLGYKEHKSNAKAQHHPDLQDG